MQHVFIIGSRGLPAQYGGFETFVDQLVSHQVSPDIQYHVACLSNNQAYQHFDYKGVDCFTIKAPKLGPARVIAYDMMAINYALKHIKKQGIEQPIFYVLGNTIGAFVAPFARKIHKMGGRFYINPDGLEWKRAKWAKPIQAYLKYSEKIMTRHADLVISDNPGIESYIKEAYSWSKTTYIAYGTDTSKSGLSREDKKIRTWFADKQVSEGSYYLVVGRFVPENNYEAMIRGFMQSNSQKDFVLITNVEQNKFYEQLRKDTGFDQDPRVKFVGTVYDQELLKYIRENAFAYFHGHEVGGTNPSLLEALESTKLNLLLDVGFNREVGEDGALYWKKDQLAHVIDQAEQMDTQAIEDLNQKSSQRIAEAFTWEKIVTDYEKVFKG